MTLCAGHELHVTKQLLDAATLCGLQQGAPDSHVLICCRVVLWELPQLSREGPQGLADGIASFGEKGPWVAERILAVSHLGIG